MATRRNVREGNCLGLWVPHYHGEFCFGPIEEGLVSFLKTPTPALFQGESMQMFNGSWSFCSIGHRLLARALEEVVVVVVLSSGRDREGES